ncbi:MAG: hypothetical protein JWP12_2452 [Bacteroidetes bacterium]|nr:hypothetical protein [Bacteroidota bacterium]
MFADFQKKVKINSITDGHNLIRTILILQKLLNVNKNKCGFNEAWINNRDNCFV